MLKSSPHPFCELQKDHKNTLVPYLWKKGTRAYILLPWYHPVCLLPVSEEKPLHRGRSHYNFVARAKKTTRLWFRRCMGTIHPSYLSLRMERVRLSWEGRSRGGSEAAHPSDLAPVIGSLLAAILVLFRSTRVRLYAVVNVNNSIRSTECQLFIHLFEPRVIIRWVGVIF